MVSGDQRPYDVAVDLLTIELRAVGPAQPGALRVLHGFHRDASLLWGFLADAVDGPPSYSRGLTAQQVEDLMRRAASEWLAMDPTFDAVRHYFDRWLDWPESINRP